MATHYQFIMIESHWDNFFFWKFFSTANSYYSRGFTYFWVGFLLCGLGVLSRFIKIGHSMGGDKTRMEPTSFENWKRNSAVWNEILDRGLMPYIERLKGYSLNSTKEFVNGWDNGILKVYGA